MKKMIAIASALAAVGAVIFAGIWLHQKYRKGAVYFYE